MVGSNCSSIMRLWHSRGMNLLLLTPRFSFRVQCAVIYFLQTISKIGLAQPGKIMRGVTADNCERHLHQLHVCAPSKRGEPPWEVAVYDTWGPVSATIMLLSHDPCAV